jgi:hypothetical protein
LWYCNERPLPQTTLLPHLMITPYCGVVNPSDVHDEAVVGKPDAVR